MGINTDFIVVLPKTIITIPQDSNLASLSVYHGGRRAKGGDSLINSDFEKRWVVIYARVSTEHEAQLSALGNQVDWYKPILAARPE